MINAKNAYSQCFEAIYHENNACLATKNGEHNNMRKNNKKKCQKKSEIHSRFSYHPNLHKQIYIIYSRLWVFVVDEKRRFIPFLLISMIIVYGVVFGILNIYSIIY